MQYIPLDVTRETVETVVQWDADYPYQGHQANQRPISEAYHETTI